jgi:uncharacterized protein (TIGR00645 family)
MAGQVIGERLGVVAPSREPLQCTNRRHQQASSLMNKSTLNTNSNLSTASSPRDMRTLPSWIFASRWLQMPLYVGLILAQAVYVFHFGLELYHLIGAAFGSQSDIDALVKSIGYVSDTKLVALNETVIMLVVLALIDVVMISNLLIMVIVGGYETFVSRMNLENHPDQPEWLSHVNASVLKVKLATAIIGISSIHLLKTFINAANYSDKVLMYQTIIHVTFLLSAMAIAYTDRLMSQSEHASREHVADRGD